MKEGKDGAIWGRVEGGDGGNMMVVQNHNGMKYVSRRVDI